MFNCVIFVCVTMGESAADSDYLLSHVAALLRPVSRDVSNGSGKLCLSSVYLQKLNAAFDQNAPEDLTSSFHLTDARATLQRDLQFLFDLVKGTVALKVIPDLVELEEGNVLSLKRFKNIKILEIHKIDVKNIFGIQRLRSQIQELTCMHNLRNFSDILDKCGGDGSNANLWSELKSVNFAHNWIAEVEPCLEFAPWLHTLNLSHNHLVNVDFINILPNLKHLNLSYNKLEKVPRFRGQVCKRLQVLLLNNNFIEDLSGLSSLTNLLQIDLSQNCILDHKMLLSISHMPSLYFLNLQGNPINFHPHHRTQTSNYLNKNTSTLKFILDNIPLDKLEKSLVGSLYPISQSSLGSSNNSSQSSLENSVQTRQKKVRNVTIQDGHDIVVGNRKKAPVLTPSSAGAHLEVKNRIEQLRQQYGADWMARHSGVMFQEVLGFDRSEILSSTPGSTSEEINNVSGGEKSGTTLFVTAEDNSDDKDDFFSSLPDEPHQQEEEPLTDDEELCDGELFLAGVKSDEDYELCVVLTETILSERDSISGEEKARWHVNVVKLCHKGDRPSEVVLVFDTLRSDRKSRVYFMEEADKFVSAVVDRMAKNKIPDERISYSCLKCMELFSRTKKNEVLVEDVVVCPKCESNHVIESK